METLSSRSQDIIKTLSIPTFEPLRLLTVPSCALLAAYLLARLLRGRSRTTPLLGPESPSLLLGHMQALSAAPDLGAVHAGWFAQYGPAFFLPMPLGTKRVVLGDPRAISHIYARDTYGYVQGTLLKILLERMIGRGVLWAEGDDHKRQRKALSPGFGNQAIKELAPIFFDCVHKLKTEWDTLLEPSGEAIIEVQEWMNHLSLDAVGLAGFSHSFNTLSGASCNVADALDALASTQPSVIAALSVLLSQSIPILARLPTEYSGLMTWLNSACTEVAQGLIARSKDESISADEDRSIMGLLLKAEGSGMTEVEVTDQIKTLLVAGYETTSLSLTWALIELAFHPGVQDRLRAELREHCAAGIPNWEQLASGMPYLDGVVHETLRLHPALPESWREAQTDDVLPLGTPLPTAAGEIVDRIHIAKGTTINIATAYLNCSPALWGEDAAEFKPERWADGGGAHTKEVQGYRGLLTFADGPRLCLGKTFAIAEMKAALAVLVRDFEFVHRDKNPVIGKHRSIVDRPKVVGEEGARVPLIVRRVA